MRANEIENIVVFTEDNRGWMKTVIAELRIRAFSDYSRPEDFNAAKELAKETLMRCLYEDASQELRQAAYDLTMAVPGGGQFEARQRLLEVARRQKPS